MTAGNCDNTQCHKVSIEADITGIDGLAQQNSDEELIKEMKMFRIPTNYAADVEKEKENDEIILGWVDLESPESAP